MARGVRPSPQALSRGKTAASARRTSAPDRAAQAAAADPAGPAPTTRTSVAAGTALAGTGTSVPAGSRSPVAPSRGGEGPASAEQGETVGGGPERGAVRTGQRFPPGAPPRRGDVVPPGGQRLSEQSLEHPADLGERSGRGA